MIDQRCVLLVCLWCAACGGSDRDADADAAERGGSAAPNQLPGAKDAGPITERNDGGAAGRAAEDSGMPGSDAAVATAGSPSVSPRDAATPDDRDAGGSVVQPLPPSDAAVAPAPAELCAACGGCDTLQPSQGAQHSNDPQTYADPPPTSGTHNPCWTKYGVHDSEVPPWRWVHNLEHGAVVYLYNCPDGCDADVAALTQLVQNEPRSVLTPYAALPTRFAVVSWQHRLLTSCVDPTAFSAFYSSHYDHGLESISSDPPVSCPP